MKERFNTSAYGGRLVILIVCFSLLLILIFGSVFSSFPLSSNALVPDMPGGFMSGGDTGGGDSNQGADSGHGDDNDEDGSDSMPKDAPLTAGTLLQEI